MNIFKSKPSLDEYDAEVLNKINAAGGFADFGAVGSMPLGYYMDGNIASTKAYHSARKLIAAKKIKLVEKITNGPFKVYLTNQSLTGELYK